jgi:hypothetical protein
VFTTDQATPMCAEPFHRRWIADALQHDRYLLQAACGHVKSEWLCCVYLAWYRSLCSMYQMTLERHWPPDLLVMPSSFNIRAIWRKLAPSALITRMRATTASSRSSGTSRSPSRW